MLKVKKVEDLLKKKRFSYYLPDGKKRFYTFKVEQAEDTFYLKFFYEEDLNYFYVDELHYQIEDLLFKWDYQISNITEYRGNKEICFAFTNSYSL